MPKSVESGNLGLNKAVIRRMSSRSLASFLFLMGRAFSLGVTLAAPAVVISAILGWHLSVTVFVICVPMILYTSIGGAWNR